MVGGLWDAVRSQRQHNMLILDTNRLSDSDQENTPLPARKRQRTAERHGLSLP